MVPRSGTRKKLHGHLPRILPAVEHIHNAHLVLVHAINHLEIANHHTPVSQLFVLQSGFYLPTEWELFQQTCYGQDVLNDLVSDCV